MTRKSRKGFPKRTSSFITERRRHYDAAKNVLGERLSGVADAVLIQKRREHWKFLASQVSRLLHEQFTIAIPHPYQRWQNRPTRFDDKRTTVDRYLYAHLIAEEPNLNDLVLNLANKRQEYETVCYNLSSWIKQEASQRTDNLDLFAQIFRENRASGSKLTEDFYKTIWEVVFRRLPWRRRTRGEPYQSIQMHRFSTMARRPFLSSILRWRESY